MGLKDGRETEVQTVSPIPIDTDAVAEDEEQGTSVVPPEMPELLMPTEGTITARAAAIGEIAVTSPSAIDQDQMISAFERIVGTRQWPDVDSPATTVAPSSGTTGLGRPGDSLDLATAVASLCAIPGLSPTIRVEDDYYFDGPRSPVSSQLVEGRASTPSST